VVRDPNRSGSAVQAQCRKRQTAVVSICIDLNQLLHLDRGLDWDLLIAHSPGLTSLLGLLIAQSPWSNESIGSIHSPLTWSNESIGSINSPLTWSNESIESIHSPLTLV
jgi:hypothetical protein